MGVDAVVIGSIAAVVASIVIVGYIIYKFIKGDM
jgi:hypothetical protein